MDDSSHTVSLAGIIALLLLVLTDAIGFAMVVPLFAAYFEDQNNLLGYNAAVRQVLYGFAVGIYPLLMAVGAPVLGWLSDRFGRKWVLLGCSAGVALGFVLIAAGIEYHQVGWILTGRAVGGVTAASQAVAIATLTDVAPESKRAFYVSMALLCSSLGFVLGPGLAGILSETVIGRLDPATTPLVFVTIFALTSFVLIFFTLRIAHLNPTDEKGENAHMLRSLAKILSKRPLRDLCVLFFIQQVGWGAWFFFIPVAMIGLLNANRSEVSLFMAVLGIGFCFSYGVLMPVLLKRFPPVRIMKWTLIVTLLLTVVSAFGGTRLLQWFLALPISIIGAAVYGALIVIFTEMSTPEDRGQVLALTASLNALAFGAITSLGGFAQAYSLRAGLVLAAIMLGVSLILTLVWSRLPEVIRISSSNLVPKTVP
jgi:DHA1 family tetracycline resistance protein-like MFS transporter